MNHSFYVDYLSKSDEPNMLDTAGEAGASS